MSPPWSGIWHAKRVTGGRQKPKIGSPTSYSANLIDNKQAIMGTILSIPAGLADPGGFLDQISLPKVCQVCRKLAFA